MPGLSSRTSDSRIEIPFRFSQASLQDYTDCPRRFRLRYIQGLTWPALDAEPAAEAERRQREGLVFHRLVHQHILGVPAERLARDAVSSDLQRWWRNYATTRLTRTGQAQHPEASLSAPAGRHRIMAKYDLVSTRDGQATIYDWKTYARRPSDEWLAARWQTRVYRALLSRAGAVLNDGRPFDPTRIRMVYWFADFPDEPAEFIYDEQQFDADWSAIESLLKEIESTRDFPLTEDEGRCRFCEFRSLCDRGGRAGPWKDLDVETPESAAIGVDFDQIIEAEY